MCSDAKLIYAPMKTPSFSIDDEVLEEVNRRLSYGDSRSEWMQNAAKMRLQVIPMLDELYEPHEKEERIMFVREAVREKANRVKQQADRK